MRSSVSPDQRGNTSATLNSRASGPSTPSTTSARPRQKNIAAQCPPVAKISASNASAAPQAVKM